MENPLPLTPNAPSQPIAKPRRRWYQFSIRGLLIFITMIAILLVFVVLPAERQRRACNQIETSGGFWMFADDFKNFKSSQQDKRSQFHRWIRHYFDRVDYAHINRAKPKSLELTLLPHLKYLYLYSVTLDSISLSAIGKLHELEKLELESCEIHAKDLSGLGGLTQLKEIESIVTEFHCDSLSGIEKLQSLELLDLYLPGISRHDLSPIAKLPRLKALQRSGLDFTTEGYAQLSHSGSLETIYVPAAQFKAENIAQLAKIKTLKSIYITEMSKKKFSGSDIFKKLLAEMQKQHPSITIQNADARK